MDVEMILPLWWMSIMSCQKDVSCSVVRSPGRVSESVWHKEEALTKTRLGMVLTQQDKSAPIRKLVSLIFSFWMSPGSEGQR